MAAIVWNSSKILENKGNSGRMGVGSMIWRLHRYEEYVIDMVQINNSEAVVDCGVERLEP